MGLDLVVEGCARPGHEVEWRRLVERGFAGDALSDVDVERFAEVSIPAYERLDAPRVGYDSAADAWIIGLRRANTPEEVSAVLDKFHGHYAVPLVKCDGVPPYSHGGLYEGVDETSFRGAFLSACTQVLPNAFIEAACEHKFPEDSIIYGKALLVAADTCDVGGPIPQPESKPNLLARLRLGRTPPEQMPLGEQLDIVRSAGRWFIFWGERGHPIRAWS